MQNKPCRYTTYIYLFPSNCNQHHNVPFSQNIKNTQIAFCDESLHVCVCVCVCVCKIAFDALVVEY